jgi:membrane protease YdiL (CAAX protease family)
MRNTIGSLWRTYVTEVAAATNAESRAFLAKAPARRLDREAAVVLLTAVLCLIFIQYLGRVNNVQPWRELLGAVGLDTLGQRLSDWLASGSDARFHQRVFWAVTRAIGYVVIPAVVLRLVLRARVVDYGLRLRGILPHGLVYLAMLLAIAPFVVGASFTRPFQATYPFYRLDPGEPLWPHLWAWELLYASQFAALEFFFRGFLLHGLKRRLGYASIFVMVVPYVMIHFEKPLAECLGAVVAGLVLGTLSLKSGSMWWGAAIHTVVAWGMDLLSLGHQGRL